MKEPESHIAHSQNTQQEPIPDVYDKLQKYWWLVKRKIWLVVLFGLIGVVYKYNQVLNIKPEYQSTATLLLDGSSTDRAVALMGIPGARYGYQNEQFILRSDKLARRIAENLVTTFNAGTRKDTLEILKKGSGGIESLDRIAGRVLGYTRVVSDEKTNLIRIIARAGVPEEAAKIANAYAETYRQNNIDNSVRQVRETKEFLQRKAKESNDSLLALEFRILNFYQQNDFSLYNLSTQNIIEQISQLYKELDITKVQFITNEEEIRFIDSTLTKSREGNITSIIQANDMLIEYYTGEIKDALLKREKELSQLAAMGANVSTNSVIKVLDDKIKTYEEKLDFYTSKKLDDPNTLLTTIDNSTAKYWFELNAKKLNLINTNRTLPKKIDKIEEQINTYKKELEIIPILQLELEKLVQRKVGYQNDLQQYTTKLREAQLAEASEGGYVTILDSAKPNYYSSNKNTGQEMSTGGLYGIVIAIGLIILFDRIDDRIKSDEDLFGFPVKIIGAIPSMMPLIQRDLSGKNFIDFRGTFVSTKLYSAIQPLSAVAELYRRLRSNFLFSMPDKKHKSILVTSSNPQEGKSVSASNLAIVLAQSGKQVLIVDADLRRPNLDILFGVNTSPGLADYIVGNASYDDVIFPTIAENLSIVPAGTHVSNPSEILGSESFKKFYEKAMSEYDFVIIDSPPVNSVVDAVTVAELIDICLIVVKAGKTKRKEVMFTLNVMQYVKHKIMGILLNDLSQKSFISEYHYYNSYNYYGNRDADYQEKAKKKRDPSLWDKLNA